MPAPKRDYKSILRSARPKRVFTCFPNLPKELRLLVWELTCFQTRTIDLRMELRTKMKRRFPKVRTDRYIRPYSWYSNCLPPAVLQVDRESRAEALKWYKLEFGVYYHHHKFTTPATVYINWQADRIFLTGLHQAGVGRLTAAQYFQNACTVNKLRFLAYGDLPHTLPKLISLAFVQPTLEELILVTGEEDQFPETHRGNLKFEQREVRKGRLQSLGLIGRMIRVEWERLVDSDPGGGGKEVRKGDASKGGSAAPGLEIKLMRI